MNATQQTATDSGRPESLRVAVDTCVILSALGLHGDECMRMARAAFDHAARHGSLILSPRTRYDLLYRGTHSDVTAQAGSEALKMVSYVCRFSDLVRPQNQIRKSGRHPRESGDPDQRASARYQTLVLAARSQKLDPRFRGDDEY